MMIFQEVASNLRIMAARMEKELDCISGPGKLNATMLQIWVSCVSSTCAMRCTVVPQMGRDIFLCPTTRCTILTLNHSLYFNSIIRKRN